MSLLVNIYNWIPQSLKNGLVDLPFFKGLIRFFIKKGNTFRTTNTVIRRYYCGHQVNFRFYASIKDVVKAQKHGIESTLLHSSIKLMNELKPNRTDLVIMDVGANFGYLSLVWAQTIAKQGKVYAFEPNARVYSSFCKSVQNNSLESIIHVEHKAVGKTEGSVELFLSPTTSNVNKAVNTMDSKQPNRTMVDMTTIDAFFKNKGLASCDLIKIDVDGIERDILEGSIETLRTFQPVYVVETNDDVGIVDFFKWHGYRVLDMQLVEYKYDDPLPPNVFCVPN